MGNFEFYVGDAGEYTTQMLSTLATNIRGHRERKGLSQRQLGIMAGVAERTIYTAELGTNIGMSLTTLFSIAWALELQPVELFGFTNTRPRINHDEYQLVLAHRKIFQLGQG